MIQLEIAKQTQNYKTRNKRKWFRIGFAFLFSVSFALPAFRVEAAELNLSSQNQIFTPGSQFELGLLLNTEDEDINALQGQLNFPSDLLELKKIRDGNSIINFWVDRPTLNPKSYILYSGIIPGGYNDTKGLIFSAIFEAKKEGTGIIEIQDAKTLLNDGQGTATNTKVSSFMFQVSSQDLQSPVPQLQIPADKNPPEEFSPEIARDPNLFNNKWFLVFSAQDKGSGIDHYEVCEGKRKCLVAESPYLLKNQSLDDKITVKAIDKNKNIRLAVVPAQNIRPWYKNNWFYAIILIAGLLAIFSLILYKTLWRKINIK